MPGKSGFQRRHHRNKDGSVVRIARTAHVEPTAYISPEASIGEYAYIGEHAQILGHAGVSGSTIEGYAVVKDRAVVTDCIVTDHAVISGQSRVEGKWLNPYRARQKQESNLTIGGGTEIHNFSFDANHSDGEIKITGGRFETPRINETHNFGDLYKMRLDGGKYDPVTGHVEIDQIKLGRYMKKDKNGDLGLATHIQWTLPTGLPIETESDYSTYEMSQRTLDHNKNWTDPDYVSGLMERIFGSKDKGNRER